MKSNKKTRTFYSEEIIYTNISNFIRGEKKKQNVEKQSRFCRESAQEFLIC